MSNSTRCPGTSPSSTIPSTKLTASALSDPNMQWNYCPSIAAATTFAVLFGILTLAHLLQAIIYRKIFCWVICMASAWETTGFALRLMGARNPLIQMYAVGSNLLVLLAPLWINAFAYMVTARMVYYWLPNKRVWKIKARTLSVWFVCLDIVTFLVQATGGSMLDSDGADAQSVQMGIDICKSSSSKHERITMPLCLY
jgi:RTA1 like protein